MINVTRLNYRPNLHCNIGEVVYTTTDKNLLKRATKLSTRTRRNSSMIEKMSGGVLNDLNKKPPEIFRNESCT